MERQTTKLSLPKIINLELRGFSLFRSSPKINVTLPDGVFCLAGANGLGKSTFLQAVNYALTGIVSDPDQKYESSPEYYKDCAKFAATFFDGRIDEDDRDGADVYLELLVNGHRYRITRNLFESNALRQFEIVDPKNKATIFDGSEISPEARHVEYTERLTADVGLESFDQFVFLQALILTFDERRHLIFWDEKVLNQALHIAFGIDPADAKRAEDLRRESEKLDSLARNANWRASESQKKLTEVESQIADGDQEDLKFEETAGQHKSLDERLLETQAAAASADTELRDANLRLADLTSEQATLRAQYTQEFAGRIHVTSPARLHPLVLASLRDLVCGLCGTRGQVAADTVEQRTAGNICPLCNTEASGPPPDPADIKRLREIDGRLSEIKAKIEQVLKRIHRLSDRAKTARAACDEARDKLEQFERENQEALERLRARQSETGTVDSILKSYRVQIEESLKSLSR